MDRLMNQFQSYRDFRVSSRFQIFVGVVFALFLVCIVLYFLIAPSDAFTSDEIFTIESGQTLSEIAKSLRSKGYIRSELAFEAIVGGIFLEGSGVIAGDYMFEKPLSAYSIAERVVHGKFNIQPVKITIPEGLNKFEIGQLLVRRLPHFDIETFLLTAPEGYLFPDTYFFAPNVTSKKAIETMKVNFDVHIKLHEKEIIEFGKSVDDIITMASIVETEARDFETRRIIAGILWKRIDEGMPLQVDVAFKYINGKTTAELTRADLADDSPYNVYKNPGLPPTPIANPGLDSILATITPEKTTYYYFLSDGAGKMHYASTFSEHVKNKQLYLR